MKEETIVKTGFSIHSIIDLPISAEARLLLIKSMLIPPKWIWRRTYIQKFLNISDRKLREIFAELKKVGAYDFKRVKGDNSKQLGTVIYIDASKVNINNISPEMITADMSVVNISNSIYIDPNISKSTCCNRHDHSRHVGSEHFGGDVDNKEFTYIEPDLDKMPAVLSGYKQWVYWKAVEKNPGEKPSKIPFSSAQSMAKTNDLSTWRWYSEIKNWKDLEMSGVGFVLTDQDNITVIDLDDAIQDGIVTEYADKVIKYFNSYTEISPSGKGFHIICTGKPKRAVKEKEIELYYSGRYICMTGKVYFDEKINDCQKQIDYTVERYRPEKPKNENREFKDNGKFTMPTELIPEGQRNNKIAEWAGVLNSKNISENDYFSYLHEINRRLCQPPLSDSEVQATGQSIRRYA